MLVGIGAVLIVSFLAYCFAIAIVGFVYHFDSIEPSQEIVNNWIDRQISQLQQNPSMPTIPVLPR
jgi:hypothetical protein